MEPGANYELIRDNQNIKRLCSFFKPGHQNRRKFSSMARKSGSLQRSIFDLDSVAQIPFEPQSVLAAERCQRSFELYSQTQNFHFFPAVSERSSVTLC